MAYQRKTISIASPEDVPAHVPNHVRVGCVSGSPVYHVGVGNEDSVGGTWRPLCGIDRQSNGGRAGARDLAQWHAFKLCRACADTFDRPGGSAPAPYPKTYNPKP